MIPVEFPQQNNVIAKPESMTDEQCSGLPAFQYSDENGYPCVLSCWKLSEEEFEYVKSTGKIWVNTMGRTVAPFALFGYDPFAEPIELKEPEIATI